MVEHDRHCPTVHLNQLHKHSVLSDYSESKCKACFLLPLVTHRSHL